MQLIQDWNLIQINLSQAASISTNFKYFDLRHSHACNIVLCDCIYSHSYSLILKSFRVHTNTNQFALRLLDVNECMTGQRRCEQQSTTCSNKLGGYTCQCKDGYQPGQSLYKCQGKPVVHLFNLASYYLEKKKELGLTAWQKILLFSDFITFSVNLIHTRFSFRCEWV